MKTIQINQFGFDGLTLREVEQPKPDPGEVLIRVKALSLNFLDVLIIRGAFDQIPLPHTPLSDASGVVEAVGEGVTEWIVGDAVITTFIRRWQHGNPTPEQVSPVNRSGLGLPGFLAEYVVLRADEIVRKPANLTFEEAATLTMAGVTAWNGLTHGQVQPGDTVLLYGTGGVSLFALAFARMRGARVVLVGTGADNLARARELGAALTYDFQTEPDWVERLWAETGGRGVDAVLELVGGNNIQKSLDAVKIRGRIAFIGLTQGNQATLNTISLLNKQAVLIGMEVGSRADFEQMNRAIEVNGLAPVIDRVFPFEQITEALTYLTTGVHFGKVVLTV